MIPDWAAEVSGKLRTAINATHAVWNRRHILAAPVGLPSSNPQTPIAGRPLAGRTIAESG
jgi:hypothetical protein